MSSIVRAISPEVPEPQPGTWSNCLVVGGVAYLAGVRTTAPGPNAAATIACFCSTLHRRRRSGPPNTSTPSHCLLHRCEGRQRFLEVAG